MNEAGETSERVRRAIDVIRAGGMVILVDDEDRENEGDLCLAADRVTPDAINFMAKHGRGLICLTLTGDRIKQLDLPMMVQDNQASLGTAFTVSIEAKNGVTTGISAKDRATTVLAAIAPDARPSDVVSPGHIFPLKARRGGVLVRTGQTEGSVDLARLAGLAPAGVICEIMRDDGEMARMRDLEVFAKSHDLLIVTIADLVTYRLQQETIVKRKSSGTLRPAILGTGEPFAAYLYSAEVEDTEYVALVRGDLASASEPVLVHVHSIDPVGDPFGMRPDLAACLAAIDQAEAGVFNKVRTSMAWSFGKHVDDANQSSQVPDRVPSEALRDFGLGAQVLADVGCGRIRLISNTERKIVGIQGFGIEVVERVPVPKASLPTLVSIDGGGAK